MTDDELEAENARLRDDIPALVAEVRRLRDALGHVVWAVNDASYKAPEQLALMYPRGLDVYLSDHAREAITAGQPEALPS